MSGIAESHQCLAQGSGGIPFASTLDIVALDRSLSTVENSSVSVAVEVS